MCSVEVKLERKKQKRRNRRREMAREGMSTGHLSPTGAPLRPRGVESESSGTFPEQSACSMPPPRELPLPPGRHQLLSGPLLLMQHMTAEPLLPPFAAVCFLGLRSL